MNDLFPDENTPAISTLRDVIRPDGSGAEKSRPTMAGPLIYLMLGLIPIVLLTVFILVRSGALETSRGGHAPWALSSLLLALGTTLAMGYIVATEAPRALARARGDTPQAPEAAIEFGVTAVMAPTAILITVLAIAWWSGVIPSPAPMNVVFPLIVGGTAIVLSCGPYAFFQARRGRYVRLVEERFPDFLRDLNESYAAGMTMPQAVRVAARGDYGKLNPEIRLMAYQVSWGASFPAALRLFAERLGTPLVERAVSLIVKATEAGGNVRDVLAAAARDTREIKTLEADRRLSMFLYVVVIYVAFGVFLAVTAALKGLLIPAFLGSTEGLEEGAAGALSITGALTLSDYALVFFGVGFVQAVGSGIVAGVMSEGRFRAGLKHSAIMVAMSVIVLSLV